MKSFKQILGEAFMDQYGTSHGPLMNASSWIGKNKLKNLVNHPEINGSDSINSTGHKTMYVGHIGSGDKKKSVAILSHSKPDPDRIRSGYNGDTVGYNKPHAWYQDTGRGYKHGAGSLTVTGHVHMHPGGEVTTHDDVDMEKSHNLMVYK